MVRDARFELAAPPSQAVCADLAALIPDIVTTLVASPRVELGSSAFQTDTFTVMFTSQKLVDTERIELSTSGCRPDVFPLELRARIGAGGDSRNPTLRFTGPLLFHLSYTGKNKKPPISRRLWNVYALIARLHTSTPAAKGRGCRRGRGWSKRNHWEHPSMAVKFWSAWRDSNSHSSELESAASPFKLQALWLSR